jgi:hypothetical protein
MTVTAWINLNPNRGFAWDVVSKDGETSERQYILNVTSGGGPTHFRGHVGTSSGLAQVDGTAAININTWYHAAMTYDGSTLRLFVNGVADGSTPVTGGAIIGGTQPLRIGGGAPGNDPPFYFPGRIDDVRLYDRALSQAEIQALYANNSSCTCNAQGSVAYFRAEGDFMDSVGTNHGTGTGVTFTSGQLGQAFNFARGASASSVVAPDSTSLDIAGPITLEAWINTSTYGGRIIDKITAGGADGYMLDTYNSRLRLIIGSAVLSSTTMLPANGGWTHVVGVYDGTNMAVYVNGAQDGMAVAGVSTTPTNGLPLRLGIDSTGGSAFTGLMDEVRIYNRALSASDVANLYGMGQQCPVPQVVTINVIGPAAAPTAPMSPLGGFGGEDALPGPWRPRR